VTAEGDSSTHDACSRTVTVWCAFPQGIGCKPFSILEEPVYVNLTIQLHNLLDKNVDRVRRRVMEALSHEFDSDYLSDIVVDVEEHTADGKCSQCPHQ
jgi:hypothetical protein